MLGWSESKESITPKTKWKYETLQGKQERQISSQGFLLNLEDPSFYFYGFIMHRGKKKYEVGYGESYKIPTLEAMATNTHP